MKSNSLTELTNIIAKGPKGRRPKVLPSSTNIFGDKFLKRTNIPVCANPLERLCELLLPWQLLNSLSEFNLQKNLIDECEEQSILPIGFESFQHYVAVWEPLLIEEIKASILSNFSTSFSKSTSVYFGVPVTEALSGKTDLILLESDFKMPNER